MMNTVLINHTFVVTLVVHLVCNDDEVVCENYNYECRPKDKFTKCSDGPYKGQCVSRTLICDNFNVCGGSQRECRKFILY